VCVCVCVCVCVRERERERESHGTCSYIRMYINAAADSVMLYLRHDFYNLQKSKFVYNLRVSPHAPPQ
jgi:hypothetical protein